MPTTASFKICYKILLWCTRRARLLHFIAVGTCSAPGDNDIAYATHAPLHRKHLFSGMVQPLEKVILMTALKPANLSMQINVGSNDIKLLTAVIYESSL
jgi:hypothetical protein